MLIWYTRADKPPIADLEYFLDFQAHKLWAPVHNDLALGPATNRATQAPALHFSLMGPKLYVNTAQVHYIPFLKLNSIYLRIHCFSFDPSYILCYAKYNIMIIRLELEIGLSQECACISRAGNATG